MESSVYSCLKGLRRAAQQLLEMEHVTRAAHDVAATCEVLEVLLQEALTPSQLHANSNGSPSWTMTVTDRVKNEDEHRVREHGDGSGEAPVASKVEDRARRVSIQQAFQAAKFAASKNRPRPFRRGKRRYARRK